MDAITTAFALACIAAVAFSVAFAAIAISLARASARAEARFQAADIARSVARARRAGGARESDSEAAARVDGTYCMATGRKLAHRGPDPDWLADRHAAAEPDSAAAADPGRLDRLQ